MVILISAFHSLNETEWTTYLKISHKKNVNGKNVVL